MLDLSLLEEPELAQGLEEPLLSSLSGLAEERQSRHKQKLSVVVDAAGSSQPQTPVHRSKDAHTEQGKSCATATAKGLQPRAQGPRQGLRHRLQAILQAPKKGHPSMLQTDKESGGGGVSSVDKELGEVQPAPAAPCPRRFLRPRSRF